jgi:hypothetical protein
MAIIVVDDDSRPTRECMICLLCVIFPPLLLVGGIYYLCQKESRCLGTMLLFIFIVESAASVFIVRLLLMKCGSCMGAYYCPTYYQDKETLCAACPSDATVNTCNTIASKRSAEDYQYIFEQCISACTTDVCCTGIYDTENTGGYFCNIINYDYGISMACPSDKASCKEILLNASCPDLCERDCFPHEI